MARIALGDARRIIMENENKELNNQEQKENKKSNVKKYLAIWCVFDLLVAVIFLMFLGIQRCSPSNNGGSTSSYKDPYDSTKLDDAFKYLLNRGLTNNGFEDSIDKVVSVTYEDTYPNNFSLSITGVSNTKVYFYKTDSYSYPESKDGYDNFVSYLLLNDNYKSLNLGISIEQADIVDSSSFPTDKKTTNYVVGLNNHYYFSGCYYENDTYYVYHMKEIENGSNPFAAKENQRITDDNYLYGFYSYLVL